jgi:DNA-binding PadR family transcriptional regulator
MNEPRLTPQNIRVLHAFIEAGGKELSGADIHERTGILSGTLYPVLIRFRQAGWLSDRWEDGKPTELGRPNRRYYRLTATGQRAYQRVVSNSSSGDLAWAR